MARSMLIDARVDSIAILDHRLKHEPHKKMLEVLRKNIKQNGFVSPITLRLLPTGHGLEGMEYELVDGAMRLQIAKEMGRKKIPAKLTL